MSSSFAEINETNGGQSDDNESDPFMAIFSTSPVNSTADMVAEERLINWGMFGLSILIVATASGNILVCLAVSWERRLQNMTNYFLMSLAIADLLVSLLVMPLAMVVELFGRFPLGQSLCVIWATMDVLLCTASIWHMCIMSMDRYFTLRYPIRYGRNKTKKMMVLKITVVWLISFAVSVPLAITGFADYSNVYSDGRCIPSIKNFILYGSIFAFYVPLIIMVVTYTLTIRILKQNRALMSGLNGNYRQHLMSTTVTESVNTVGAGAGDSVRRQGDQRYGNLATVGVSPQQSGYTITSAGLTSAKCSSTDSPVSPAELRSFIAHKISPNKQLLSDVLKINLTDETNYLNYTFDQVYQTDSDSRLMSIDAILKGESRLSRPLTFNHLVPLSSSSSSSSSCALRVSRSQPSFFPRSSAEVLSQEEPRSTMQYILQQRSSDSNLAEPYSSRVRTYLEPVDRKQNGSILRRFFENNNPNCAKNDCRTITDYNPTNVQDRTSNSVENMVDNRHSPYLHPGGGREQPLDNANSCLSAIQTPPDGVGTPSQLRTGRYKSVARNSPYNQRHFGGGTNRNEANSRTGHQETTALHDETTSGYHTTGLLTNGSAKRSKEIMDSLDVKDQDEALRMMASQQGRDHYRPITTAATTGSWSLCSPSNDTSPSRSEGRTFVRSRIDHYRRGAKKGHHPSTCARKVGMFMSQSRSTNEEKASKVLGIIFAVFVLFWTPFFTMNIVSVLCDSCMQTVTSSMMTSMVWLGYLSSLANPIIYTMFSISFRTVFYRILTCQYKQQANRCGTTSSERYLCWSRRRSNSFLKELRSEFRVGGS